MGNFIICSAKTFIQRANEFLGKAGLMGLIERTRRNPIKDLENTYKELGHEAAGVKAKERLESQIEEVKRVSQERLQDITSTVNDVRIAGADKKLLTEAAIAGQSKAITEPITMVWKTLEQSNEALKFVGRQLEKDGKVLTKDADLTEYVLENAIDSWLTVPQHRIRGSAAQFDNMLRDFYGMEGLSGISGKVKPEVRDKASELVMGELKGNNALVKYLQEDAKIRSESEIEARDRINEMMYKASDADYDGGDPVLNLIANSFKHLNDKFHAKMKSLDPRYDDAVMEKWASYRPSHARVVADPEAFKAFARDNFDRGAFVGIYGLDTGKLSPNQFDDIERLFNKELDEFVKRITHNDTFSAEPGFKGIEKVYSKNNIVIADTNMRAQYDRLFTDQYGGPFNAATSRMRSRIKQAAFAKAGHHAPDRLLADLRFFLRETESVKSDVLDRVLAKTEAKIKDMVGSSSHHSPTAQNVLRGTNQLLSTVTGASALRNWYDYVVHPAIVKALVVDGDAPVGQFANFARHIYRDSKELVGLTAGAAKDTLGTSLGRKAGKESRAMKLARFWEQQGAYIQITRSTMNRGFSDAMEGAKYIDEAADWSKAYNKYAEKSQDIVNDISFADATNIAGRVMHTNQVGSMLYEALGHAFDKNHKVLGKKFKRYGIGEQEWEFLRALESIGNKEFGVDIAKKVEYTPKEMDKIIPRDGTSKLKQLAEAAAKETERGVPQVTARRILGSYQNLMNAAIDELASTPGVRGTTFEGNSNSLLKALYDVSIGKFLNITFSQWYQLYRAILDSIGLNPNLAGSYNLKTIGKMARHKFLPLTGYMGAALAAQTGAGILYIWMRDLARGDAPRSPTFEVAREAALSNGFAGVWGMMASNLMYGEEPFSTPATAFIRPLRKGFIGATQGDGRKVGDAALDATRRFIGPLDALLLRGVYDKAIRRNFVPLDKRQKNYRKKRGQGEGVWESHNWLEQTKKGWGLD